MQTASNDIMVITGGSRGIGRATALKGAAAGYQIYIGYRADAEAAQATVSEITEAGGSAQAVVCDVADEDQILELFAQVDASPGRLRVLVNNAGVVDLQASVEQMTQQRLQRMFAINVIGSFLCAREAVKRLSTQRGGSGGAIVNVSSVASRLGAPGEFVDYAAAKAAIDTFTTGLAKEVAEQGIRVNAVRPGLIYTDIHEDSGEPGRAERMRSAIPMQRIGTAEEVAAAIIWLASDEASYSTGAIIDVSGGR